MISLDRGTGKKLESFICGSQDMSIWFMTAGNFKVKKSTKLVAGVVSEEAYPMRTFPMSNLSCQFILDLQVFVLVWWERFVENDSMKMHSR